MCAAVKHSLHCNHLSNLKLVMAFTQLVQTRKKYNIYLVTIRLLTKAAGRFPTTNTSVLRSFRLDHSAASKIFFSHVKCTHIIISKRSKMALHLCAETVKQDREKKALRKSPWSRNLNHGLFVQFRQLMIRLLCKAIISERLQNMTNESDFWFSAAFHFQPQGQ